jgi:hypothetical protein
VCHQTASLAARHLEASGIPTVLFGCARDIVECCGVPRFVFSDFPLGNPTGRPLDPEPLVAIPVQPQEALHLLDWDAARRGHPLVPIEQFLIAALSIAQPQPTHRPRTDTEHVGYLQP